MKEIKSKEELKKELTTGKVVLKLGTTSCGPCQSLSKVLEELEKTRTDVLFLYSNVDENEELAEEFKLRCVPALIFYDNGEIVDRTGFLTKKAIEEKLNEEKENKK